MTIIRASHIDQTRNKNGKVHRNDTIKKMHFLKLNSPISFIKFMDFYGFTIKSKKHNNTKKVHKNNIAMAQTQYTITKITPNQALPIAG